MPEIRKNGKDSTFCDTVKRDCRIFLSRSQTPRFCIIFSAKPFPYPNFEYFCGQIFLEQMDAQLVKQISDYFATQPVLRAWVFGSYARGEEREDSDIDLLVELDESQRIGIKFFGMYVDLKEILGREVDLVADGCLMPFAEESANRDKKLIYERNRA